MRYRPFYRRSIAPVLVLMLFAVSITAQEPGKTLQWANHASPNDGRVPEAFARRIDEIELEDIRIDGRSILIGEPFVGDFRDLSFRVKNVSDKPIGFIQITVTLPEVAAPPQIPFLLPRLDDGKTAKPLRPGEETDLKLVDAVLYKWVKDTVASQGNDLQRLTKAWIYAIVLGGQNNGGCMKTRDERNECRQK